MHVLVYLERATQVLKIIIKISILEEIWVKINRMKPRNLLVNLLILGAGLDMPFIVIGSYFNFIPKAERSKPLAICFLVLSVLYAVVYAYFSWQAIKNSGNWRSLTGKG